jgi:SMC interacting uncharacterized protein involved in chromosome segregation
MIVNNFQDHLQAVDRFNQSEERLDKALKNLEEIILNKIESLQTNKVSAADLEEISSIDNLSNEINNLQKSLAEIGAENESLIAQNKILSQKIANFKNHLPEIIAEIESDLSKINSLVKK